MVPFHVILNQTSFAPKPLGSCIPFTCCQMFLLVSRNHPFLRWTPHWALCFMHFSWQLYAEYMWFAPFLFIVLFCFLCLHMWAVLEKLVKWPSYQLSDFLCTLADWQLAITNLPALSTIWTRQQPSGLVAPVLFQSHHIHRTGTLCFIA